jgi:hypothetical protein
MIVSYNDSVVNFCNATGSLLLKVEGLATDEVCQTEKGATQLLIAIPLADSALNKIAINLKEIQLYVKENTRRNYFFDKILRMLRLQA